MAGHQVTMKSEKAEQEPRHQRQLRTKPLENLGKGRNDEEVDDHDGHRHGNHHKHRVAQRRLHLFAHETLEFQVLEQAQENFIKQAGRLAHPHHGDVEGGKHLGMAGQGHRQFTAGLQAFAHVADRPPSLPDWWPIPASHSGRA